MALNREEVWLRFAVAVVSLIPNPTPAVIPFVAMISDSLTEQWSTRFGDAAFLLDGQSECAACHRQLPQGTPFVASKDGVKFCNMPCLQASGREE